MPRLPIDQLALFEAATFAGGPPRLPKTRHARSAPPASLPLPFGARETPPPPKVPPKPRAEPSPELEPEEHVFLFVRRGRSADRAAFLSEVEARLPGAVRRSGALEWRPDAARVRLSAEGDAVRILRLGRADAWLAAFRELARESGLVEPE
jgi:hypothetical protein